MSRIDQEKISGMLPEISQWRKDGLSLDAVAQKLGISRRSLKRCAASSAALAQALAEKAPEKALTFTGDPAEVEAALFRRATGYCDADGKVVQPDVRAAIFWLQNRCPEIWQKSGVLPGSVNLQLFNEEINL